MAVIKAVENLTLDGVMEAPESWAGPYQDEVLGQRMAQDMALPGGILLGRRTYELFMQAWAGRDDNPFTPVLESRTKYVVSRTLSEPPPRQNSTLVGGDLAELKRSAPESRLVVLGSGELKAKLTFEVAGASKSALEAIERAGGSVKVLNAVVAEA